MSPHQSPSAIARTGVVAYALSAYIAGIAGLLALMVFLTGVYPVVSIDRGPKASTLQPATTNLALRRCLQPLSARNACPRRSSI